MSDEEQQEDMFHPESESVSSNCFYQVSREKIKKTQLSEDVKLSGLTDSSRREMGGGGEYERGSGPQGEILQGGDFFLSFYFEF